MSSHVHFVSRRLFEFAYFLLQLWRCATGQHCRRLDVVLQDSTALLDSRPSNTKWLAALDPVRSTRCCYS